MLQPESIRIDSSGIAISGEWGDFVPTGAIGDGYQATLAWVADMLGWSFLFQPSSLAVSGVVLIDEIEKHLHPRWQRQIVKQLRDQFPSVQFIATTHSPICAGGLADLAPGAGLMYYCKSVAPGAVACESAEPFAGWRYDQIITSEAFGLGSARDVSTEEILERIRRVYDERGTAAADSPEVKQAVQELAERSVEAAEDERDRQLRASLAQELEEIRRMMQEEQRS
jgi:AAA domain, putative AbiEii toxin, Type IV TA system